MGRGAKKVPASKKSARTNKKGSPTQSASSKAGIKRVDIDDLEREQELEDKYEKGPDEAANNVLRNQSNRNTEKPDIDKPSYS